MGTTTFRHLNSLLCSPTVAILALVIPATACGGSAPATASELRVRAAQQEARRRMNARYAELNQLENGAPVRVPIGEGAASELSPSEDLNKPPEVAPEPVRLSSRSTRYTAPRDSAEAAEQRRDAALRRLAEMRRNPTGALRRRAPSPAVAPAADPVQPRASESARPAPRTAAERRDAALRRIAAIRRGEQPSPAAARPAVVAEPASPPPAAARPADARPRVVRYARPGETPTSITELTPEAAAARHRAELLRAAEQRQAEARMRAAAQGQRHAEVRPYAGPRTNAQPRSNPRPAAVPRQGRDAVEREAAPSRMSGRTPRAVTYGAASRTGSSSRSADPTPRPRPATQERESSREAEPRQRQEREQARTRGNTSNTENHAPEVREIPRSRTDEARPTRPTRREATRDTRPTSNPGPEGESESPSPQGARRGATTAQATAWPNPPSPATIQARSGETARSRGWPPARRAPVESSSPTGEPLAEGSERGTTPREPRNATVRGTDTAPETDRTPSTAAGTRVAVPPGTAATGNTATGNTATGTAAAGTGTTAIGTFPTTTASTPVREAPLVDPYQGQRVLLSLEDAPTRGTRDALATIVVFSDFTCSACSHLNPALNRLLRTYPNEIQLVFRHNVGSDESTSELAAETAVAAFRAGGNGAFWQMHDLLFAHENPVTDLDLRVHAVTVGMELEDFEAQLTEHRHRATVQRDRSMAEAVSASASPAVFINGRRLTGQQTFEGLQGTIQQEIRHARRLVAAGVSRGNLYETLMLGAIAPEPQTQGTTR